MNSFICMCRITWQYSRLLINKYISFKSCDSGYATSCVQRLHRFKLKIFYVLGLWVYKNLLFIIGRNTSRVFWRPWAWLNLMVCKQKPAFFVCFMTKGFEWMFCDVLCKTALCVSSKIVIFVLSFHLGGCVPYYKLRFSINTLMETLSFPFRRLCFWILHSWKVLKGTVVIYTLCLSSFKYSKINNSYYSHNWYDVLEDALYKAYSDYRVSLSHFLVTICHYIW